MQFVRACATRVNVAITFSNIRVHHQRPIRATNVSLSASNRAATTATAVTFNLWPVSLRREPLRKRMKVLVTSLVTYKSHPRLPSKGKMLSQQDGTSSGRLNPADQQQVVKREQAPAASTAAAAPGAAASSQASGQRATTEAAPCTGMSCAMCPPGPTNPFLPPAAASADDLDALRSVQEAALAANQASAPSPATDDFSARDFPTESLNFFNFPDSTFSAMGLGFAADYLGLADEATTSKAHYMSANCVVFTNYSSGDAAAEVDEHFSRALGSMNKQQSCSQTILGKPSVFDMKSRLFLGNCTSSNCPLTSSGGYMPPNSDPWSAKKNASTLHLPGSMTSLNQMQRTQPWPQQGSTACPPPPPRTMPSYNAFNAYWSGQYHSVSCPNTPLQHPTAPGQQAFQFNTSITTGSDSTAVAPQQREFWY